MIAKICIVKYLGQVHQFMLTLFTELLLTLSTRQEAHVECELLAMMHLTSSNAASQMPNAGERCAKPIAFFN